MYATFCTPRINYANALKIVHQN